MTDAGIPRAPVFLNIPYDLHFQDLYIAYIAGVASLGLHSRATVEIVLGLKKVLPALLEKAGTKSPFKARVFDDLRVLARALSDQYS